MNSTPTPKVTEANDALIARADERLARAYEQITRAEEQLARVSEQLAKMERDAARPPSAGPEPQSPPRRPVLRALVGLPLAACIVVAALVLQSSYGGGAKQVVARWAPQLVSTSSLPPENSPFPTQPAPPTVQVAAAEAALPQATPLAQTAPQDASPTATAAVPDYTQLLQTMAHDLANAERNIEQLKANQQQIASDNLKAIEQLKASQEEIKRVLTKVSEQNLPKTSPPPRQPTPLCTSPSGDFSRHMRERGLESQGSGCTRNGSRRCSDRRSLARQQYRTRLLRGCAIWMKGPDIPSRRAAPRGVSLSETFFWTDHENWNGLVIKLVITDPAMLMAQELAGIKTAVAYVKRGLRTRTGRPSVTNKGDEMNVTTIPLWGSAILMAGGAFLVAGIGGVCIAIGFVLFLNLLREQLEMAIKANGNDRPSRDHPPAG